MFGGGDKYTPNTLLVNKDLNLDSLTNNELMFVHTLLHKFFGQTPKNLTKSDIETLHREIKTKISHQAFDTLDKVA
mgnify:CR=1 FL=1